MTLRVIPPGPSPVGPGWYAISIGVNALVLTGLVWLAGQRPPLEVPIPVARDSQIPIEYLVYLVSAPDEEDPGGEGDVLAGGGSSEQTDAGELPSLPEQPRQEEEVIAPPTEVPTEIVAITRDSASATTSDGTRRHLGPSFGTGELWSPVELNDRDRALIALHLADLDSVYRNQLMAAIMAIPPDSFALAGAKPWVTEINGQTIGIDEKFIHLGPIKIPTILLALLPIPATGSYDQAVEAREYERIRQEILFHAARQADREQVDDYIKELREREDEKRRQRRALLARPDTIVTARDTIIPR